MSLNSDWNNFILNFSAKQIEVTFNDVYSRKLFNIHDFLDTGIELSNEYGFLSLKFKSSSERAKFVLYSKIAYSTNEEEEINWRNSNWTREDYPCRIFLSSDEKS
ncbi:MAG: hypothetical protein K9G41_12170 [Flavobacteriales bacterium]|nr:hypothetical protein [Flavobacteriales bacterium]